MKKLIGFLMVVCMCLPLAIPAFAASNTGDWDIAESGKGEKGAYSLFWPKTGTLTAYYYGGVAVTDERPY